MKPMFPGSALSHGQYHIILEDGGQPARCAILAVMFLKKRAYSRAERVVADNNVPNISMIRFGLNAVFGDKYTPTDDELIAWLSPINIKPVTPYVKKIRTSHVQHSAALPGRTRRPGAGATGDTGGTRAPSVCGRTPRPR